MLVWCGRAENMACHWRRKQCRLPSFRGGKPIPVKHISVLLLGTPGIGKTTLANTAEDALLLDFDRGFAPEPEQAGYGLYRGLV